MAYHNQRTQSLYGRRVGLQLLSTVQTGGSRGPVEFIVGPEAVRRENSTSNSTSVNVKPWGFQYLPASSAGSSQVYTIDPPIPGTEVTVFNSTGATAYLKMPSGVVVRSTVGSTQSVIALPAAGASIVLTAVSTSLYLTMSATATGINLTNTT